MPSLDAFSTTSQFDKLKFLSSFYINMLKHVKFTIHILGGGGLQALLYTEYRLFLFQIFSLPSCIGGILGSQSSFRMTSKNSCLKKQEQIEYSLTVPFLLKNRISERFRAPVFRHQSTSGHLVIAIPVCLCQVQCIQHRYICEVIFKEINIGF